MGRDSWSSRRMVEQCRALNVDVMQRDGVFTSPSGTGWKLQWYDDYGGCEADLDYWVIRSEGLWLHFGHELHDGPDRIELSAEQRIRITSTRPHFGGKRYWFMCRCGRRVGRLYLPPGQKVFACRHCYNLTYRSAREHDAREYKLARNPRALYAALRSKDPRRAMLGLGAVTVRWGWARRREGPIR